MARSFVMAISGRHILAAGVTVSAALSLLGCGSSGGGSGPGSGGAAGGAGTGGTAAAGGTGSCTADVSTDPENCGECGRSCYGGTCQAGRCGPVVVNAQAIGARTDGSRVAWWDGIQGQMVYRELKSGVDHPLCAGTIAWTTWPDGDKLRGYDASEVLSCDVASSQSSTKSLGPSAYRAFTLWGADLIFLAEQDNLVYFANTDGSNVTSVPLAAQQAPFPSTTAANADSFFVIFTQYDPGTNDGDGIARFRKTALGTPEPLLLTFRDEGGKPLEWIAADETHVYATRVAGVDDIVRVGLDGSAIEVLEEIPSRAFGLAVGTSDVFWQTSIGGDKYELRRRSKSGGPSELELSFDGEPGELFARSGILTWHTISPYALYYMRVD